MEEMKKIVRVAKPDCTLFIGEATTGNDCVEQALQFQQAVKLDGIVLSKVDVDERGGAALSISFVTKKPILFFGTGQTYNDLEPFDKARIVEQLTA
jgi:fused signal recognition particle receptor